MGEETKKYSLGERTKAFAKKIRLFVKSLPKTSANVEDSKQLIRSSGSVGANFVEAEEALSKKDFLLRIKICRKEAKESGYWLELIEEPAEKSQEKKALLQEALELTRIFGSIVEKLKQ